jgi:TonB family protein
MAYPYGAIAMKRWRHQNVGVQKLLLVLHSKEDSAMLGQRPKPMMGASAAGAASLMPDSRQHRKMFLTLVLLLCALAAVVIKDRDFWFGSFENVSANETTADPTQGSAVQQATVLPMTASPLPKAKKQSTAKSEPSAAETTVFAVNRTAVPPLEAIAVQGEKHSTLQPRNYSMDVQIAKAGEFLWNPGAAPAEHVSSSEPVMSMRPPAGIAYPMLSGQSKVQGSVVVEVLVGADGAIQNTKVVSGPPILASAAREAVRQWHFKPFLQDGKAVPTKATVTVNLKIKVLDNPTKA